MRHRLRDHEREFVVVAGEVDHAARDEDARTVGVRVDVVGVAHVDRERAGARDGNRQLALGLAPFDRHRQAGLRRHDLAEGGDGLRQRVFAGRQRFAAGGEQHVARLQARARGAAAGQHVGHLQVLAHAERDVRRFVVFARIGPAVLGGEAEQVAGLPLAQFRILDQQRRGHLVQPLLQIRHLRQGVGGGGHLRAQARGFDGALGDTRRGRRGARRLRGAGRQQQGCADAQRGCPSRAALTVNTGHVLLVVFTVGRWSRNRRRPGRSLRNPPRR